MLCLQLAHTTRLLPTLTITTQDPTCSEERQDPSDDPVVERIGRTLHRWGTAVARTYKEKIAAPTDADCRFDLRHFTCAPIELCAYQFAWGDLHPNQSCRLRVGFAEL
jgi:hypothetical protein